MNKERRKYLENAIELFDKAREIVDNVCREESDALDNLPDGIRESDRGDEMEDNVSVLEDCLESIDGIVDNIAEIVNSRHN